MNKCTIIVSDTMYMFYHSVDNGARKNGNLINEKQWKPGKTGKLKKNSHKYDFWGAGFPHLVTRVDDYNAFENM